VDDSEYCEGSLDVSFYDRDHDRRIAKVSAKKRVQSADSVGRGSGNLASKTLVPESFTADLPSDSIYRGSTIQESFPPSEKNSRVFFFLLTFFFFVNRVLLNRSRSRTYLLDRVLGYHICLQRS
jgi:hypothetical protein